MTNGKRLWWAAWTLGGSVALSGCMLDKKEDAGRFREALPKADQVEVSGPETAQGQQGASSHTQADEPWANGPWAKYYGFTRVVRDGVNAVTGVVLGSVWIIAHTDPTSVENDEAIWGPWTDSLSPATYRFRVTEIAPDEYEYRLEGRPKASSSDGDFRAVMFGKGFGKGHASHGDGEFTIDLDTARALDPFYLDDDTGSVKVIHDLPANITDNLFALPKTITAEIKPSDTTEWWTVTSHARQDGTGTLLVNAYDDVDDSGTTQSEDIQIASQWNQNGAGRADITLSGGDIPADPGMVTAVECWDSDFYSIYYADSLEWQATEGDVNACAYDAPLAP
jgi:hypothetical protein